MSLRVLAAGALAVAACVLLAARDPQPAAETANDVFGLTNVHRFHLVIGAKEYAAMEPPARAPMFGPGAKPPGGLGGLGVPGKPPPGSPDFGAGNFGFEFEYVRADFQAEGRLYPNVAVRYKGSGTYLVSARHAKRSFKIDFDRYDDKQSFHGLAKLNLNNGVMDPTKAREALAYAVFRAAGVPAPRTAFAEVALTVPGKYDKEHLGVYTVVEQADQAFLKAHFGSGKGLLLKPEGIRGVPHFGEDRKAYEQAYAPKTEGDEGDWKRLIEFTRLVNKADEGQFQKEIRAYLDVDAFVRFLAANTLLASLDGFIGLGHNYYLYLHPETGRFTFFPWDLDLAFGGFFMFGPADQQADLSIDHPHVGENKLIDRLLAMPEVKKAYRAEVRRLAEEVFTREKLGKDIEAVEGVLKDLVARDREATEARKERGFGPPGMGMGGPAMSLQMFREKRAASIASQLEGKSKGHVPAAGFGGFGQPGGFGPGNQLARPLLGALDADKNGRLSEEELSAGMKKLFLEWDKDKNGTLDQRELADGLQKLAPAPAFGGPGPGRP